MPAYANLGVSESKALRLERSLLADHILGTRSIVRRLRAELTAADMSLDATEHQRQSMLWQKGRLYSEEQHLQNLRYLAREMKDER